MFPLGVREYDGWPVMFDLTTEVDHVRTRVFDETGMYVASFVLDGPGARRDRVPGVRAGRAACLG
jgi:hypothetical protein